MGFLNNVRAKSYLLNAISIVAYMYMTLEYYFKDIYKNLPVSGQTPGDFHIYIPLVSS